MTYPLLAVSNLRPATALLALTCICGTPRATRAQATAPDFRTGFCVGPDTTRNGGLSSALSAVVSEPEHGPVPLSSTIPPYPKEVRRDGYHGTVLIGFVVDTLGRPSWRLPRCSNQRIRS
jgi:outer membrane biosynthesis protein TonB